jgi:acetylornithine deacetylase
MRSTPFGKDDSVSRHHSSLNYWEEVLLHLISIPSVTGHEGQVAEALEGHLQHAFPEARVWRQPISERRWNVIMEKGASVLTLSSHMDVVPGGPRPLCTDEFIVGRGACDAKGQIVAQLWGLEMAIGRGVSNYRCAFVVGEEADAIGAQTLLQLPPTRYMLNGEPTGGRFVRHSWGSTDLEISMRGESAHSSLGTENSAIHKLIDELQRLLVSQPAGISFNVGMIRGGLAANIQAPFASCNICVRIRDSSEALEQFLRSTLHEAAWTLKSPLTQGIDLFVPEGLGDESIEVMFASDCSLYVKDYEHVMLFGPGSIREAHTDHESLSRAELRNAAERICEVVCKLEA